MGNILSHVDVVIAIEAFFIIGLLHYSCPPVESFDAENRLREAMEDYVQRQREKNHLLGQLIGWYTRACFEEEMASTDLVAKITSYFELYRMAEVTMYPCGLIELEGVGERMHWIGALGGWWRCWFFDALIHASCWKGRSGLQ